MDSHILSPDEVLNALENSDYFIKNDGWSPLDKSLYDVLEYFNPEDEESSE